MWTDPLVYEQPVNEHIRACLRLEHLFSQATHHMQGYSPWESRAALAAILEILNILDRPDIKTKLAKELGRVLANLSRLENTPHIDQKKLTQILVEIEDIIDVLHATNGRIGDNLRENEFLNTVRQHLFNPGGACAFEVPAYHYWLQQPMAIRVRDLMNWLNSFTIIQAAVNLMLRLIRQSSATQIQIAKEGFYQVTLDPQAPCQLIKVEVPRSKLVYPEISVGRHGICIRFFEPSVTNRSKQTVQDIEFKLTNCIF